MRIKAIGRYLLVRMDHDSIDEEASKSRILRPKSVIEKEKSGVQIHTILSIGASAFDDEPAETIDFFHTHGVGRQILTGRYPGHEVQLGMTDSDAKVNEIRMISSDEIHGLVALDDEEGVDV